MVVLIDMEVAVGLNGILVYLVGYNTWIALTRIKSNTCTGGTLFQQVVLRFGRLVCCVVTRVSGVVLIVLTLI